MLLLAEDFSPTLLGFCDDLKKGGILVLGKAGERASVSCKVHTAYVYDKAHRGGHTRSWHCSLEPRQLGGDAAHDCRQSGAARGTYLQSVEGSTTPAGNVSELAVHFSEYSDNTGIFHMFPIHSKLRCFCTIVRYKMVSLAFTVRVGYTYTRCSD